MVRAVKTKEITFAEKMKFRIILNKVELHMQSMIYKNLTIIQLERKTPFPNSSSYFSYLINAIFYRQLGKLDDQSVRFLMDHIMYKTISQSRREVCTDESNSSPAAFDGFDNLFNNQQSPIDHNAIIMPQKWWHRRTKEIFPVPFLGGWISEGKWTWFRPE